MESNKAALPPKRDIRKPQASEALSTHVFDLSLQQLQNESNLDTRLMSAQASNSWPKNPTVMYQPTPIQQISIDARLRARVESYKLRPEDALLLPRSYTSTLGITNGRRTGLNADRGMKMSFAQQAVSQDYKHSYQEAGRRRLASAKASLQEHYPLRAGHMQSAPTGPKIVRSYAGCKLDPIIEEEQSESHHPDLLSLSEFLSQTAATRTSTPHRAGPQPRFVSSKSKPAVLLNKTHQNQRPNLIEHRGEHIQSLYPLAPKAKTTSSRPHKAMHRAGLSWTTSPNCHHEAKVSKEIIATVHELDGSTSGEIMEDLPLASHHLVLKMPTNTTVPGQVSRTSSGSSIASLQSTGTVTSSSSEQTAESNTSTSTAATSEEEFVIDGLDWQRESRMGKVGDKEQGAGAEESKEMRELKELRERYFRACDWDKEVVPYQSMRDRVECGSELRTTGLISLPPAASDSVQQQLTVSPQSDFEERQRLQQRTKRALQDSRHVHPHILDALARADSHSTVRHAECDQNPEIGEPCTRIGQTLDTAKYVKSTEAHSSSNCKEDNTCFSEHRSDTKRCFSESQHEGIPVSTSAAVASTCTGDRSNRSVKGNERFSESKAKRVSWSLRRRREWQGMQREVRPR